VFITLIVLTKKFWWWIYRNDLEVPTGAMLFFYGLVLFFAILLWITTPLEYRTKMAEFESVKQTIQNARSENISEFERITIQNTVIEWNAWLTSSQYKDKHFWIELVPSEIQDLTPIE